MIESENSVCVASKIGLKKDDPTNINLRGLLCKVTTLESGINITHSPTLIIFLTFFQGLRPYSRLHRAFFSNISIRYV